MASLFQEIKSNKLKFFKTCLVYFAFLGVGCGISITGPTLLDLQIAVSSSLSETSHIIQGRSVGYAIGSVVAGFLLEMFNEQLVMGVASLINGIALAITAWNRTLWGIVATLFINGLAMSHVDTGSNVCILRYWGRSSGSFLQILHFMFTTGGLIAPILVRPYLLERVDDDDGSSLTATNSSYLNESLTNVTKLVSQYSPDDVLVQWPFTMVAGIFMLAAIGFLTFYYCVPTSSSSGNPVGADKSRHNLPSEVGLGQSTKLDRSPSSEYQYNFDIKVKILIIAIISVFSHIYFGVVISFANLLPTFAVKSALAMTKTEAANLMTVFWSTTTLYRIPVILFANHVSHTAMILIHVSIMVISSICLCFFGESYVWAIYLFTAMMGIGIGPVFAAVLGYLQQYFPVTGRITSLFIVSACIGEFLYPWIISQFLEDHPSIFLYVMAICSIVDLIAFIAAYTLCNIVVRKYTATTNVETLAQQSNQKF